MSRRLVVEADGGSRGNPGPAGYGALVRDAETHQVLARVAEAVGIASNNVAEYGGLVAGLRLAVALDPQASIEVRMDSKLVVEQMSGRWKIKHEDMRRLATEARAVVDPGQVRYTWVPREQNKDADQLANEAMDDAARGVPWRGSVPPPAALDGLPADAASTRPDVESAPERPRSTLNVMSAPLRYRLLTGSDDRAFCEKVSAALEEGYQLHGGPTVAYDGARVVVAQAVVLQTDSGR